MLTPALHHILLALLPGERHGYAIMQDVERITAGGTRMGPGTLYGAIKRLLEAGLIEEAGERDDPSGDERRRYYRITGAGRHAVVAETTRLQRLVAFADGHLRGSELPA
ncbi:MAG: PadR family transcriptional regulator [Pseudomonadota bacterium]|nr:PadR family transcriptional regulator [Pseudomonadota bacterium]